MIIVPGAVFALVGEISVKETSSNDTQEQSEEPKILVKSIFDPKASGKVKQENNATNSNNVEAKKVKVSLSAFTGAKTANTVNTPVNPVIPETKKETPKMCDLYLKVSSENGKDFEAVRSVLDIYNYGNTDVVVYFEDTNKLCRAVNTKVEITPTMLKSLYSILSEQNVKLKEKKN